MTYIRFAAVLLFGAALSVLSGAVIGAAMNTWTPIKLKEWTAPSLIFNWLYISAFLLLWFHVWGYL